ncbi:glycoside hydrolase family 29 (alpha-L-fucosidase) [Coriobacterium glomerans PW2]|uniref:alpha-L-fucosidase n=2 Tax=Coriobacterium TaxID=33870 RepID=F2N9A8_CORGP|nr:glycoside hydrolase family 29 (alpha-L-fucosidase) [Coriobacterium glomerans PW2]
MEAADTSQRLDIVKHGSGLQETYDGVSDVVLRKIEAFRDLKIGVIFHWGLYSLAGIVESWQLSEEDTWARKKPWRDDLSTLRRDYWGLADKFNPTRFHPDEWARICNEAGIRYMLFTTKHHDGFNMFGTDASAFSVLNTPFKRDVFSAVSEAFQRAHILTGAYYSKPDWHSPFYWEHGSKPRGRYASYDPLQKPEKWRAFNKFVKRQLVEICSKYGPQEILWLDGGWVNRDNNEILDMDDIVAALRTVRADLIVVDRTLGGKYENYVTPERMIPSITPIKAWESGIPLAKNWGYVPRDSYKPFEEILDDLICIVSKGGNALFGIGPKPNGELPYEALDILARLGSWLSNYGEGIYKTRPLVLPDGFPPDVYGTRRDHTCYLFARTHGKDRTFDLSPLLDDFDTPELLNQSGCLHFLSRGSTITVREIRERYAVIRLEKR